ncbi:MAG: adenine phosphoribosyltransferase [Mahellales bacterium]|jgi:adenine phosphoribosyltransferase
MDLKSKIRVVEDFPKPGISFKDITTLLKDNKAYVYAVNELAADLRDQDIDLVIGPEARGFVIGAPLAYALNCGFVPIRKAGKLPAETKKFEYELEYGKDVLEIHADAISPGQRVVIADDLLATGGTAYSTVKLVEELGGKVVSVRFIIELTYLNGAELLKDYNVKSLIKY